MDTKSRIRSVIQANQLDFSNLGLYSFDLSSLQLTSDFTFQLPTNLRLGQMVEKIVSKLLKSSVNYKVLHENVQILQGKLTIGELDFILENNVTKELIHLELAYKFYLFDPAISKNPIENWIGPNRKDSLKEKLEKLQTKQFPLLYKPETKKQLSNIAIDTVAQKLCLLASLYIPYGCKTNFDANYTNAIKGYYLSFETFSQMDHTEKLYYLPTKKEWGINPSEHTTWAELQYVEKEILKKVTEKHAPLCWLKHKDSYEAFFIVWW